MGTAPALPGSPAHLPTCGPAHGQTGSPTGKSGATDSDRDDSEPADKPADDGAAKSASASSSDALAPNNVIILPPPTVIIPFPAAVVPEGGGSTFAGGTPESVTNTADSEGGAWQQTAEAWTTPTSARAGKIISFTVAQPAGESLASGETKEHGIEEARLAMLPAEADELAVDNIQVIDFRQPAEAKIIRLPVLAWANAPAEPGSDEVSAERRVDGDLTQLPVEEEPAEEIAWFPATGNPVEESVADSGGLTKPVAHAALPRVQGLAAGSAEATGITTARQEMHMDSLKNAEPGNAFAGRGGAGSEEFPPASSESARVEVKAVDFSPRNSGAMDWHLGRPVSSFDRPSPIPSTPLTPEQSATVERISNLMVRETSLVRQYSSDSMAVVLRPDDQTELYVHFSQRNGQIEATIRCDRGDARQLGALWPQLQDSLAQQRVRLAPLQEGPSAQSSFNHAGSGASGEGNNGSQRHTPSDQQSMDERSAPASSTPDVSHVRGRGGSRRRLTTSRPGWETWA